MKAVSLPLSLHHDDASLNQYWNCVMFCMVLSSSVCAQLSVDTTSLMMLFFHRVWGCAYVRVYFHTYGNVLMEKGVQFYLRREFMCLPKYLDRWQSWFCSEPKKKKGLTADILIYCSRENENINKSCQFQGPGTHVWPAFVGWELSHRWCLNESSSCSELVTLSVKCFSAFCDSAVKQDPSVLFQLCIIHPSIHPSSLFFILWNDPYLMLGHDEALKAIIFWLAAPHKQVWGAGTDMSPN